MRKITEFDEWKRLTEHYEHLSSQKMQDWFDNDSDRFSMLSLQVNELFLDYSKNLITEETILLLCKLANTMNLQQKIHDLFKGIAINNTEQHLVLHTALRDKNKTPIYINSQDVRANISASQDKVRAFIELIYSGKWKGVTGKSIRYIVNIGIGGSYIGPMMAINALTDFIVSDLRCYFISTIDDANLKDVLKKIDPETTLFIISSKSFSTLETLTNAQTVFSWMKQQLNHEDYIKQHFIAITAAPQKAMAFGLIEENIFPLWDFIGGRYSIWSAIGLPLGLMIGNKHFSDFLAGAYEMDRHFLEAPFEHNMPVLLGLLSIWYTNFFAASAHAIAPYSFRLRYLISYLQQLQMESNGRSVTKDGASLEYATSIVIFGQEGCEGQHAYYQLLYQGQMLIPVDYILVGGSRSDETSIHQDALFACALSQAQALMRGKTYEEAYESLLKMNYSPEEAKKLAPHQVVKGNKPCNILLLSQLTPKNLGALLALYEHKIFVQSVIWDINPFDQWGVELGKQLVKPILNYLQGKENPSVMDRSIENLINYYKKLHQ